MKARIKNLFLLPALIAGFGSLLAGQVSAQTFTVLHNFTGTLGDGNTNYDGTYPQAGLILSGNTLYGTAHNGGASGLGTVFAINTTGTGFTTIHSFADDVAYPSAGLVLSGGTLYGTTSGVFDSSGGTVFAVNTNGTGYQAVHSFDPYDDSGYNNDGYELSAGVILSGNTLYGTARLGGSGDAGTIFAVNTNDTGFTVLHNFTGIGVTSDGAEPRAGLILSGNTLYGTTWLGGASGNGTVFAATNGGLTILHSFTAILNSTNGDGTLPQAGLILSGNMLYGTASAGGNGGNGTVFAVNTNGTGFTVLHNFTGGDGASPEAGLILSGNTLYGTTSAGGSLGDGGTMFSINTDGTGFTTLYDFSDLSDNTNGDGYSPQGGLILSGNTLYGTAQYGGISGNGTVFSLMLPPPLLTINLSGANVILTWPANAAGFNLQSAPDITGTFTNIPGATSPCTNSITGTRMFFRLSQ